MDYLHMSTFNRIVQGEEVVFDSKGITNEYFRRRALEAATNVTNSTAAWNASSQPANAGLMPAAEGCFDVGAAFETISSCTGGLTECPQAMGAAAAVFRGTATLCTTIMWPRLRTGCWPWVAHLCSPPPSHAMLQSVPCAPPHASLRVW
eukprot:6399690-Prymnesium_polylepis.1